MKRWRVAVLVFCSLVLFVTACGGKDGESAEKYRMQLPVLDARVDAGNALAVSALSRPDADHAEESQQIDKIYRDMRDTLDDLDKQSIPSCLSSAKGDIQGLLKDYRDQSNVFALTSKTLGDNNKGSFFLIAPSATQTAATKAKLKLVLTQIQSAKC